MGALTSDAASLEEIIVQQYKDIKGRLAVRNFCHKYFHGRNLRIVYIGDVKHDNARDNAGDSGTYLLTLANRNDPICATSSKVAKASTISVAVAGIIAGVISLTFTNVNTALRMFMIS